MSLVRLAWNMLLRDFRAGEWRVLLVALVLAVASIATVGLFADRVRQALQTEAHALLGADLRLSSTRAIPAMYRDEAQRRGLRVVATATFPSVVRHGQQSVLAELLAVEAGYPLRGSLVIDTGDGMAEAAPSPQPSPNGRGSDSNIPAPGTAWADERLLRRLDLQTGDTLEVGALHLRLAARVVRDVDQSAGFASFAPRLTLNAADLPASGLVQEGSRISHRLLFSGDAVQLAAYRGWLETRLGVGEKLEDVRDARPEIRIALERAEHFLGLAALTAVVLAGVALALAARRFITRHLDACAVMRCLGASQSQVLGIFLLQFLWLGLAAVLLGDGLGYAAQVALVQAISAMREAALPAPGALPLMQAAASGMALLLGFTFLPLWQLKQVPPLRVIRRELGAPGGSAALLYLSGGAVLGALFLWQAGSVKLGLAVLGGLAAGLLGFGVLAWALLRGLARLPLAGHHAYANLARHGRSNAVQIVALSLGGMALLSLTLVRDDLLQSWQGRLPPDAPNRFLVNVQPDQVAGVGELLVSHGLPAPTLLPMVRGRLLAINQRPVRSEDYPEPRARALVEREFNLSWADKLPEGNALVSGAWWALPHSEETLSSHRRSPVSSSSEALDSGLRRNDETQRDGGQLSVEEGIAKTLDIHLGDTLTYDLAGETFTARVASLRRVQWDSMRVNFFVIAAPGLLENAPASYITSFHLPPDQLAAEAALLTRFPNVLVIDTGAVIAQVRVIMDQITRTLGAVFLFTLLAGLAVLYAALLATQDERIKQTAILRTLGADSRYLRRLHLTEFAVLGGLSGAFAAAGAEALGYVLARHVLDLPFVLDVDVFVLGGAGGVAIVMLAGWFNTRRLLHSPPRRLLLD
ncbi:FtsX-like permease family protein [Ferriphaselus sp. R-1]|uniref:ABC transporter permease n=1 Tax=Ferriphaselus sp. R-1 TaxID=1485544 RepID=UPI00054F09FB|nr:FtsX-like permease family protein [Ferriphaselus sp. R-1]